MRAVNGSNASTTPRSWITVAADVLDSVFETNRREGHRGLQRFSLRERRTLRTIGSMPETAPGSAGSSTSGSPSAVRLPPPWGLARPASDSPFSSPTRSSSPSAPGSSTPSSPASSPRPYRQASSTPSLASSPPTSPPSYTGPNPTRGRGRCCFRDFVDFIDQRDGSASRRGRARPSPWLMKSTKSRSWNRPPSRCRPSRDRIAGRGGGGFG